MKEIYWSADRANFDFTAPSVPAQTDEDPAAPPAEDAEVLSTDAETLVALSCKS